MASIQGIYLALFGRPADPAGLAYFNGITNNGANLAGINNLSGQAEYTARFTGLTNTQIVNSIYQALFGRDGETAGIDFFVGKLASGELSINNIAIAILDGAQGADKATVDAKIAAANLFTAHLDTTAEQNAYSGTTAINLAKAYIDTITASNPGTEAGVDAVIVQVQTSAGQDPGGNTGGGGGGPVGPDAPVFFATLVDGKVTFSGTAEGDITEGAAGVFSRGGTAADSIIPSVTDTTLVLSADQHLILTASQAHNQGVSGAGSVDVTGLGSAVANLSEITATGVAHVSATATLNASSVLSQSVAVDIEAAKTLTLTAAQANDISIKGAGNANITASTGAQTIKLTDSTGTNTIHTGTGGDTVTGGSGTDTIFADDARTVTGTPEKLTFDLTGNSGSNSFRVSGGGLANPVVISINNSNSNGSTAENNFVSTFNANSTLNSLFTASIVSNQVVITSKTNGDVANISVAPEYFETDYIRVNVSGGPVSVPGGGNVSVTIQHPDFTNGSLTVAVTPGSTTSSNMTDKIVAAINTAAGSIVTADHATFGGQEYVTLTWKTPGDRGTLGSVSENGTNFSISTPFNQSTPDYSNVSGATVTNGSITINTTGAAVDTLKGGAGNDIFVFSASTVGATDKILDFNANEDKIKFDGGSGSFTFVDKGAASQGASLTTTVVNNILSTAAQNSVTLFNTGDGHSYVLLKGDNNGTFTDGVDQVVDVTGHSGTFGADDFLWLV